MEDKRQQGYPVYAEDELGMLNQVASGSDCTGLEPTPPIQSNEAESYAELYSIPKMTSPVNNAFQEVRPDPKKRYK
jgi:hypothetical protein